MGGGARFVLAILLQFSSFLCKLPRRFVGHLSLLCIFPFSFVAVWFLFQGTDFTHTPLTTSLARNVALFSLSSMLTLEPFFMFFHADSFFFFICGGSELGWLGFGDGRAVGRGAGLGGSDRGTYGYIRGDLGVLYAVNSGVRCEEEI